MNYQSKEIKALRILNQNLFDLSVNPLAAVNFNEKNDAFDVVEDAVETYVKHKEIEEELGIELEVLFKALNYGIYTKFLDSLLDFPLKLKVNLCKDLDNTFVLCNNGCEEIYYFKDYGKTWALTKEELL